MITYLGKSHLQNVFTLVCNTTTSPPTEVTWMKDGTVVTNAAHYNAYQVLLDGSESTYSNFLEVDLGPPGLIGEYTCIVSNLIGTTSSSVTIQGKSHSIHVHLTMLTDKMFVRCTNTGRTYCVQCWRAWIAHMFL